MISDDHPLAFAHAMVELGVPVFKARKHELPCWLCNSMNEPCHFSKLGFWLPKEWQFTAPEHRLVESWRLGDALCAVMGHVFDLVDYDLRNDPDKTTERRLMGEGENSGLLPLWYAQAITPSGGRHYFIKSLNVRSMDNLMPGLDIKAGKSDADENGSHGRGYAFIAPTVKISKMTGEPAGYQIVEMPRRPRRDDDTGEELLYAIKQHWDWTHPKEERPEGGFLNDSFRDFAIRRAVSVMRRASEGTRDVTLTRKLWLLATNGATDEDYAKLADAARLTGLDPKVIEQKIQRARRRIGGRR